MILNPTIIVRKFKCNKEIADFLVFKCGLPILSVDKGVYYFTDNEALKNALKKLPMSLRLSSLRQTLNTAT